MRWWFFHAYVLIVSQASVGATPLQFDQSKDLRERSEPGAGLPALHHRNRSSLSPINPDKILAPVAEVERNYRSYEEAARQACLYVLTGKIDSGPVDKQTPPAFTLSRYTSKADQPAWIKGKTVGLGYKEDTSSDLIGFIQLEYNAAKKFHFSVQALNADRTAVDLNKIRLLAKFPSSASDSDQHFQALVEPLDRKRANDTNEYEYSAANIWDLWRNRRRPRQADRLE
ncbi:hypothetical protein BN14_11702 [Rhizoctonia solani AG-1 IB]|uniref:Uncharacterized protein n=1 Tax=Thanatephorus cucumeris (strain AG1-IB / isolate 7/3/14) TaxID=1108050 RepID=M5CDS3_THACB|nr:hypothetical protein BN14_11702 [Rhizoctonia solani AG-1 IB]